MKNDVKKDTLINFMKENNLTKKEFCKRCGFCCATLNTILYEKGNFRLNHLFKIAKVMNIHIKDLFPRRGEKIDT